MMYRGSQWPFYTRTPGVANTDVNVRYAGNFLENFPNVDRTGSENLPILESNKSPELPHSIRVDIHTY